MQELNLNDYLDAVFDGEGPLAIDWKTSPRLLVVDLTDEVMSLRRKIKFMTPVPNSRESLHIYELYGCSDHGNFYVAGVGSRDQMYFRKGEGSLYPYTPTWFNTKEEARIAVEATGLFKVDNPPVKTLLHIKCYPHICDVGRPHVASTLHCRIPFTT